MDFNKKQQEIIANYMDCKPSDQVLKNAKMLAVIYDLLERIEKLENKDGD